MYKKTPLKIKIRLKIHAFLFPKEDAALIEAMCWNRQLFKKIDEILRGKSKQK